VENLLVLALAALIVMSSGWFQRVLERRVIASLENLTGGRVEIGHFHFKPWVLQITLQKLVIHGSEAAGDPPLLSAGEVDVAVNPAQLLRRRLHLRHVDVNDLQVHLRTNPQGITSLPGQREQPSAQQGLADLMNLFIARLTVSRSAFFWNDQRLPMEIDARELAMLLSMSRGRYTGTISSSATTLRSSQWTTPPIHFNSRFELSPASLVFSSLAWQAPGTAGEASFTILPRLVWQASGAFHASAEIATLARLLHAPEFQAGTVQVEGLAVYEGGNISAQGRAQVRQLAILTPAHLSMRLDATTSYALEKNQLDLTNLLVSVWGGTAQGTLHANFQDSPAQFRLNSHIHQVRLDDVLRSASTPTLLTTQLHPVSMADGAVSATWSGGGKGLKADFDLALQAPAAVPPDVLPVSGAARGTLEDGQGLTLRIADSEFRTPHSTITGRGTLAQKMALPAAAEPFALTVTTGDFEEWRPLMEALVAAPSGIPLELKSPAGFSGQLSGSAEAPSLQGRVRMGQFKYHGWAWDRLTAMVALNPGLVQISGGRVDHAKSSFEFNGSAHLEDWQLTPSSVIRFSAQAQHTPVEGLTAVINSDLPIRGTVTGSMEVEGTVANLGGSGSFRVDAGAFADEPFDSFSTQLQVAQSMWKLQNILLTKGHGRVSGALTVEPENHFVSGQLVGTNFRLADIH